jgi:Domain of unknown function (DUF4145)
MAWQNLSGIGAKQFRCGHCGFNVANDKGYFDNGSNYRRIYVCPNCDQPTIFSEGGHQYPGVAPGNEVQQVPKELAQLYLEARNCCSVSAFTASVLTSRKTLMNIAVQQGAKEGLKFIEYVEYLAANGFIPPNGKGWVDHIRKKGNEATHEIALMGQPDAEELVAFTEMLLKFIYEFPSRVPKT